MENTVSPPIVLEAVAQRDPARARGYVLRNREQTKERFYVLSQSLGWGFFWATNVVLSLLLAKPDDQRDPLTTAATVLMVATEGLLITHFSRRLIERWGWKQLGWRALGPRLFGFSVAQSLVWTVVGYSYTFILCWAFHQAWPSKYNPAIVLSISVIQGTSLLAGWHCIYFFYHLFDRFNRLEIEQLRLVGTAKESELRALKSQVNPHFIFNSLNSLRALIDENPARARLAVTQLSNLLRYSLQSGQLETVPFEDELRVVNDYLALEQVRHEERLRVRLDIAPDTLALPVPPMLLQTLVENAVKYGIATRPEGGEVAIIARCVSGALSIQVTNPGSLATPAAPARAASTGVGLRNAAERLRLLFGERATLQLRTEAPALVVAEAVLPVPAAHRA